MQAAVIPKAGEPIAVETRQRPAPGPDQVLVRVRACGICRSDLDLQAGHYTFARMPVIPGHEVAGVVEEVGQGVTWPAPGARIGMPWLFSSCGRCSYCVRGDEILCAAHQITGVTVDGGYADYMLVPAAYAVPLPDGLDFVHAAPLMCAGLAVFNGLRVAGFVPGDRVAIIGFGGLGHLGVQYARAMGARVAVVTRGERKRRRAEALGAERVIDLTATGRDLGPELHSWDGGANIILATAPATESASSAVSGLAPDGTLVILGVGAGELVANPLDLILGRRRVVGSPTGSRHDAREALAFAAAHDIRPSVTCFALGAVNDAFASLAAGRLPGRAVLVPE